MNTTLLLITFVVGAAVMTTAVEHRGMCPKLARGTLGTCVELCSSDDDCEPSEKCCSHGCGHSCQLAQPPLPIEPATTRAPPMGVCPPVAPGTVGTCAEECGPRGCASGQLCCSNGCGHTCQWPIVSDPLPPHTTKPYEKAGACPGHSWYSYILSKFRRACANRCAADAECSGTMKCCRVGCGTKCTQPLDAKKEADEPMPISRCALVRCAKCHKCVGDGKCVPDNEQEGCDNTCHNTKCDRDTECVATATGATCRPCPMYKLAAPPPGCTYERHYPNGNTGCAQYNVVCDDKKTCRDTPCKRDEMCRETPSGPQCSPCPEIDVAPLPAGCTYARTYPMGDTGCAKYELECANGPKCGATQCERCHKCVKFDGKARCVKEGGTCCPDGSPVAMCAADPCSVNKCPGSAHCVAEYCGSCKAIFYDHNWQEMSVEQCTRDAPKCGVVKCEQNFQCVDQPTGARCEPCPMVMPPRPGCTIEVIHGTGCPVYKAVCDGEDKEKRDAPANPCAGKPCGKCDKCVAVNGEAKCVRKDSTCCKPGQHTVQCFANPCMVNSCDASAHCVAEYCDGCNAIFYDAQWNRLTKEQCAGKEEQ